MVEKENGRLKVNPYSFETVRPADQSAFLYIRQVENLRTLGSKRMHERKNALKKEI